MGRRRIAGDSLLVPPAVTLVDLLILVLIVFIILAIVGAIRR